MDSIAYKKIITKPSLDKMKVWELIFFMFWDMFKDNEFKNEKGPRVMGLRMLSFLSSLNTIENTTTSNTQKLSING